MFDPSMVPTPDPNPLPGPFWVFKLLLVVTFALHILAMNFMLGGAVLALLARWRYSTHYSTSSDGEWIGFPALDQAPYRKLVRAISRVRQKANVV